jgi:ribonuclease P protein subunit POP4
MNEKKLARDELIGLNVKIIKSSDPNWTKKTGTIIDETKNTFLIKIDKKNKRIAKNIAEFEFEHNGKLVRLNGSKISYKPEDRIKKIKENNQW